MAANQASSKGAGKGRQNGPSRSHFSAINSRLISVAKEGKLDALLEAVAEDLPQMNLVNLSTALHRLAKLTSKNARSLQFVKTHASFGLIVAAVRRQLAMRQPRDTVPQPQALSNAAWALATLEHVDVPLLELCASLSTRHVASFKPFELSSLLWAFATFDALDPAACACAAPLFQAASALLPAKMAEFSFRCLVMTVWAFATAGHHDEKLFASIAKQMARTAHTANRQDLGNAAWAFSHAGFYHDSLFAESSLKLERRDAASKRRRNPSECSTGVDADFNDVSSLSSEEIFAHDGFVLSPPIGCLQQKVNQESLNAWRMQYQRYRAGSATGSVGEISSIVSIAEDAPCTGEKLLPPPLSIIPQSVHAEELAAFRKGYQQFRAGKAKGAKGEISDDRRDVSLGAPKYIRLEDLACKFSAAVQGDGQSDF
eukprot:TRINITY_DN5066_c0_g1_i1.p1 TRINITY_DN5066_c0_g1~~TRINITY_DN5066_c0_g1_i1.p1  ORF type:complete len:445 (-),score=82.60 TRINITY_DN5066_c0_g1_i1:306-1592(-)